LHAARKKGFRGVVFEVVFQVILNQPTKAIHKKVRVFYREERQSPRQSVRIRSFLTDLPFLTRLSSSITQFWKGHASI